MKKNIHPKYNKISIKCSCGFSFKTKSTIKKDMKIEICSQCHPFYTGKSRVIDTEGRVELFNKKFGK